MGDCNLSLYNSKCTEKICKYSYTSWCPTCDRNPPRRRRSRSETNEPCRRKCREMKTFTPKKYSRSHEYENMELGYDLNDYCYYEPKDYKECCRVRANLCELPTTYISNNCQIPVNICNPNRLSRMSDQRDYVNCVEENVKTYEQTLKFVDVFDNSVGNFEAMSDRPRPGKIINDREYVKASPAKFDSKKPAYRHSYDALKSPARPLCLPVHKTENLIKSKSNCYVSVENSNFYSRDVYREDNQGDPYLSNQNEFVHSRLDNSGYYSSFNPKPSQSSHSQNNICYDTCTFFDKKVDTSRLREDYHREMEVLREKLVLLKKNAYANANNFPKMEFPVTNYKTQMPEIKKPLENSSDKNVAVVNDQGDAVKSAVDKVVPFKANGARKKGIISPPLVKNIKNRVSVKTKGKLNSLSTARLRKTKPKTNADVQNTGEFETDVSGSDGDDEEEEIELNEDSDPDSESSSNKSKENIPISSLTIQQAGGDTLGWPVRPSLFPNIPPYINFSSYDSETVTKLPCGRKHFQWKLSTITPVLVRKTLTNSGFVLVRSEFSRESNQWIGTWGKHMKSPCFKTLKVTQKLNHYPGTFQLGRKDRLWRNFQRLINKFGTREFGFLPHTYVIPQELRLLKQNWEFKNGSGGEMWIIKPPASARGVGIKVINKWCQLPKKMSLVVQKYISNPYLINGSKFDLRLYVLVTSFNPLRIYLYPEGLARFASAKYSGDTKDLKDRYMHLTNYSINKLSSHYTPNEDADTCQGHKWTISKLFQYMQEERGVDTKTLWKSLEYLVIKTIITSESPINQLCEENMNSKYNCYELFGVDVLLDEKLKPWLLEVNISPSLHSASPLDAHVKGPLVQLLFNLAQFHLPPKLGRISQNAPQCYDPRLYTTTLMKKERQKHAFYTQLETRDDYIDDILENLTGDDVRHLTKAEDEFSVKGRFQRIFPTSQTHKYLHFMETRYYNRLFDAWETRYEGNRERGITVLRELCAQKIHLKVAPQNKVNKNSLNTIPVLENLQPVVENQSHHPSEVIQESTVVNSISSN